MASSFCCHIDVTAISLLPLRKLELMQAVMRLLHITTRPRVAAIRLLEMQKMAVKRAALMQRRLLQDLPAKIAEKRRRDKELHVPCGQLPATREGPSWTCSGDSI